MIFVILVISCQYSCSFYLKFKLKWQTLKITKPLKIKVYVFWSITDRQTDQWITRCAYIIRIFHGEWGQWGCLLHYFPKFYNNVFSLVSITTLGTCPISCVLTFQPLTLIYRRGYSVYHNWGRTSIYRPLSYPFRSLGIFTEYSSCLSSIAAEKITFPLKCNGLTDKVNY